MYTQNLFAGGWGGCEGPPSVGNGEEGEVGVLRYLPARPCRMALGWRAPVALGCSRGQNLNDWLNLSRGQCRPVYLFNQYLLNLNYVPSTELGIGDTGMSKTYIWSLSSWSLEWSTGDRHWTNNHTNRCKMSAVMWCHGKLRICLGKSALVVEWQQK